MLSYKLISVHSPSKCYNLRGVLHLACFEIYRLTTSLEGRNAVWSVWIGGRFYVLPLNHQDTSVECFFSSFHTEHSGHIFFLRPQAFHFRAHHKRAEYKDVCLILANNSRPVIRCKVWFSQTPCRNITWIPSERLFYTVFYSMLSLSSFVVRNHFIWVIATAFFCICSERTRTKHKHFTRRKYVACGFGHTLKLKESFISVQCCCECNCTRAAMITLRNKTCFSGVLVHRCSSALQISQRQTVVLWPKLICT